MPGGSPAPSLETERLLLRPFEPSDAPWLQALAGERRIADTMISVPHPFTAADAAAWIGKSHDGGSDGHARSFAVALRSSEELLGHTALYDIDAEHRQAEVSFSIGGGYEGAGYVTEAARQFVDFAFEDLGLNRLCAFHMVRNAGSGRVLEKLGFRRERLLRQRVRKWGVFEDVLAWGLLRSDR